MECHPSAACQNPATAFWRRSAANLEMVKITKSLPHGGNRLTAIFVGLNKMLPAHRASKTRVKVRPQLEKLWHTYSELNGVSFDRHYRPVRLTIALPNPGCPRGFTPRNVGEFRALCPFDNVRLHCRLPLCTDEKGSDRDGTASSSTPSSACLSYGHPGGCRGDWLAD